MAWEYLQSLRPACKNFILLGEAGSGKSEIALNLAVWLAGQEKCPVHFFDLDMTKPLFRSRDAALLLEKQNVCFHYEEQFMDAPTQVGGLNRLLQDEEQIVVMDVGGDYIGARAVGGYAGWLNRPDTAVFYAVNPYRPWSNDIDHIDETLGKILGVSHIRLNQIRFISNPNNGVATTPEEFARGNDKVQEMLSPYCQILFACVRQELYQEAVKLTTLPVMPMRLYLTYPWLTQSEHSAAAAINENKKNPEGGSTNG